MPSPLLTACEGLYFPRALTVKCELTKKQYRYAIADLEKAIERKPEVADLTDDNLALMFRYLLGTRKVCPVTANERVGRLKTLATFCWKRGLLTHGITLGRMKVSRRAPRAWSLEDIQKLLEACSRFRGHLGGVRASLWFRTMLSWLWGTGCRIGETLALRWDWIDLDRGIASIPAEARKGQVADKMLHLPAWLVAELRTITEPSRDLVFPFPRTMASLYERWKKLIRWSGVEPGRLKNHKMRVSHATWTEVMGGDAQRALGHASRSTTENSYLDPRFLQGKRVEMPPPDGRVA